MKKLYLILLAFLLIVVPMNVNAISKDYVDKVHDIVGKKVEENKINVYFFNRDGCPHCAKEEEFFKTISEKYKNVNIYSFEVSKNSKNSNYLVKVKELFNDKSNGVPFTIIGEKSFLGYNSYIGENIEKAIQTYLNEEETKTEKEENVIKLPIIGETDLREVSVPFIAIVLGLIDGFNPCAMWVLLFLINMFFGMKNKKRMFLYGYVFLFTSGLVYLLSMLGISVVLDFVAVKWLQILIACVAIVAGILNVRTYIKTKNDDGCHVVDEKKRKTILKKGMKIVKEKNVFIALVGIIILAASVNIVELACSLGFPAIFAQVLSLNDITGVPRVLYLLLYVLFYMADDLIVFTIATATLSITTRSSKYTKYANLVGGVIMILIGLLLIFKPDWVMFNF